MMRSKENLVAAALVGAAILLTYWSVIRGLVGAWSTDPYFRDLSRMSLLLR